MIDPAVYIAAKASGTETLTCDSSGDVSLTIQQSTVDAFNITDIQAVMDAKTAAIADLNSQIADQQTQYDNAATLLADAQAAEGA